jgi:hypothetical protein
MGEGEREGTMKDNETKEGQGRTRGPATHSIRGARRDKDKGGTGGKRTGGQGQGATRTRRDQEGTHTHPL